MTASKLYRNLPGQRLERGFLKRLSPPSDGKAPTIRQEPLVVSQALIDIIRDDYPGMLTQAGDEFHWHTAHGGVIRLILAGGRRA